MPQSTTLPGSATSACLLCGSVDNVVMASFLPAELRSLWRHYGVEFTAAAWGDAMKDARVERRACRACGFEFFDPKRTGSDAFYAELQAQLPHYYPHECVGFERAVRFARAHGLRSVLDIGCGCGDFLDHAHTAGLSTTGVELNPSAAARTRAKGHRVLDQPIEVLARAGGDRFALVTTFEVLEHVGDPAGFVAAAAALVMDGGYLAVTVPQRGGVHDLCRLDPHNWPPHHISHWRHVDLVRLAARHGLRPVWLGGNFLEGADIRMFLELRAQLGARLGRPGWPLPAWLPRTVGFAWRMLGLKHVVPRRGMSLFGFFVKQAH